MVALVVLVCGGSWVLWGDSMTVNLAPVDDVEAFAKKIDFGKVTDTDVQQRLVKVSVAAEPSAP